MNYIEISTLVKLMYCQLERKRHIGNDIVVLLFSESEKPFDLSTITSKQIRNANS